jgi:hypothetical protein
MRGLVVKQQQAKQNDLVADHFSSLKCQQADRVDQLKGHYDHEE